MEYYSAFKSQETQTYATMWMNPEDVILSDISQSQKDTLYEVPRAVKFTGTEGSQVVAW